MTRKLTTHVLDTSRGRPAEGMKVDLYQISDAGSKRHLCSARTNTDGKLEGPLLEDGELLQGIYEIIFHAGVYFEDRGQYGDSPSIWGEIPIRITITNPEEHYHIPLLIAPGGYSTYRGS